MVRVGSEPTTLSPPLLAKLEDKRELRNPNQLAGRFTWAERSTPFMLVLVPAAR